MLKDEELQRRVAVSFIASIPIIYLIEHLPLPKKLKRQFELMEVLREYQQRFNYPLEYKDIMEILSFFAKD